MNTIHHSRGIIYVKTDLIKFINVPFASICFTSFLSFEFFWVRLHLKQLVSIVLDALNQVLHRILQTNVTDRTSSSFKFKRTLFSMLPNRSSLLRPLWVAQPWRVTVSTGRQGDHLYTQKRITCTQGSLVHIEPHLYTYRNKNLRSLVHTES